MYNSSASNPFAEVVKVIKYTGLRDAELAKYSPALLA